MGCDANDDSVSAIRQTGVQRQVRLDLGSDDLRSYGTAACDASRLPKLAGDTRHIRYLIDTGACGHQIRDTFPSPGCTNGNGSRTKLCCPPPVPDPDKNCNIAQERTETELLTKDSSVLVPRHCLPRLRLQVASGDRFAPLRWRFLQQEEVQ